MPDKDDSIETEPMHHREITLVDGRYMIFYTFGESVAGRRHRSVPAASAVGRTLDTNDVDSLPDGAPSAEGGGAE